MYDKEYLAENKRKDALFKLFESLEEQEHKRFERTRAQDNRDFDKIFNGVAIVSKVNKSTIALTRESGKQLGVLMVTPQIAQLIKEKDHLMLTARKEDNHLRVMFIQAIATHLGAGRGQTHISGSINPRVFH